MNQPGTPTEILSLNRIAEIILPPHASNDLRDASREVHRRLTDLFALADRKPGSPGVHMYVQVDGRQCTSLGESIAHINSLPPTERGNIIQVLSKSLPG